MPDTAYKRCPHCERTLPRSDFARDASKASGHKHICKPCDSARPRKRQAYLRLALEPRTCEACSGCYTPRRRDQRFCSAECHRHRGRRKPAHQTCKRCGAHFLVVSALGCGSRRYCSDQCRDEAQRDRARARLQPPRPKPFRLTLILVKPCAYCSTPTYGKAPCCSHRCYVRRRDGLPRWHDCAECGETFDVMARSHATLYCSTRCATRRNRRIVKRRRRRALRHTTTEPVDIKQVAIRDGWRCHICKRKVSTKTWSLDHLIPVSYGGPHTYANVALAHHRCNTLRSNTGPAQLLLVG